MNAPAIEPLGDDALLIRLGDHIDIATNRSALEIAESLRATAPGGIVDIAPAYASVAVRYDIAVVAQDGGDAIGKWIERTLEAWQPRASHAGEPAAPSPATPENAPVAEIPVCYGGRFGPDLEAVAAHTGLDPGGVIARHAAADYRVAMLGFMPGFPYLLGLDPALHMPRRARPRTRVPAGSVAIGGAQTGIYPRELPGGWQLIGRTPLALFDPEREAPALLRAGQQVRFRAIDAAEFEATSS